MNVKTGMIFGGLGLIVIGATLYAIGSVKKHKEKQQAAQAVVDHINEQNELLTQQHAALHQQEQQLDETITQVMENIQMRHQTLLNQLEQSQVRIDEAATKCPQDATSENAKALEEMQQQLTDLQNSFHAPKPKRLKKRPHMEA